jgi:ADP-heptose:LPS heptosyltransferase
LLIGSFTINNAGLSFKERIIQRIIVWHYYLLNFTLLCFQRLLFRNKNISGAKKILIFRTGSIGDGICALPAINSIRKNFPEAEIDILTNAGAESLISLGALIDSSIVNEVIDYLGLEKKQLIEKLKKKQYELFIQLPQYEANLFRQIRDILFAKFIGTEWAFGWHIAATWFLAKWQARLITFVNERDRLLKILEKNGLKSYGLVYPLGIDDEMKSKVQESINDKGIKEKVNNVGMVVGAKRPQNRWPIEYFKEVADYLLGQKKNILLFGAQEDFELAEQIKGENVFNFCGKLTPLETAEIMKHCRLVISNDTGPMHLAYAVGTPLITIFSSRDYPGKWFPPLSSISLRSDITLCYDCFENCQRNNECMKNIRPQIVIDSLKKFLAL